MMIVYMVSLVLKKTSYRNKVSRYVFKYPGTKFRQQKVTKFLASDENFYRRSFYR